MDRKYTPPKCDFMMEGRSVTTDQTYKGHITGTSVGGILGVSPWSTPFKVACELLGVAREDISDKPAVRTGQALEHRIIEYAGQRYAELGLFIPADEVYEERKGDHDSWASDFDDPIFAGHVDGLVMDENGGSYILEIKTSANMDSWQDGVPEYYYWQVALYNYFITKKRVAYVVLGIVDSDTYKDPTKWEPNDLNVVLFKLSIDTKEVEARIAELREWYATYIEQGRTPEYDPKSPIDTALMDYITSISDDETAKGAMLDRLASIETMLKEQEDVTKGLRDAREDLRKEIKDYMLAHGLDSLESATSEYVAVLSDQERTEIDPVKLAEDGIDPEPYRVTKVTKVLKIKRIADVK